MSAEKTGQNGPALPVPPEEEDEPAPAAAAPAEAANPCGDAEVAPAAAAAGRAGPIRREAAGAGSAASEFSDAVAIQFPSDAAGGARKPYFIFGDGAERGRSLVLRSGASARRASSPARAARTSRRATRAGVTGVASYDQGEWSVIFKRAAASARRGRRSRPGQFVPIAFSVWDGFSRERGNRRGLTLWYSLYVEPRERPVGRRPDDQDGARHPRLELAIVGWVRWRSARARASAARRAERTGRHEA